MATRSGSARHTSSLQALQEIFVSKVLSRVQASGQCYFRNVRCPNARAELIAEMVALSWKWFIRLCNKGKDPTSFVGAIAVFAARAVRAGRRVGSRQTTRDALSPGAGRRHGFTVGRLPDFSTLGGNPLDEALQDNTRSEVPEQVAFRLDFRAWRRTYTDRDRRLIDCLMVGERTSDVSRAFGISPARVSQKRREFHDDWLAFCSEARR